LMTLWWDKIILSIKITKCLIKKQEAISKKGFWFKVKAGPSVNRRHTQVCRGIETRAQHRD
jgi:hypothetical protein